MGNSKTEWDTVFLENMFLLASSKIKKLDGIIISVIDDVMFMDKIKLHSDTKLIIYEILIFSIKLSAIIIYFEYVCRVFKKIQS